MLKRLAIIGLLTLSPLTAVAAPLSPWVNAVLSTADAGMSTQGSGTGDCEGIDPFLAAQNAITPIRQTIDLRVHLALEREGVADRTACFQHDLHELEAKMEQIRTRLVDAFKSCQPTDQLVDVYMFVATAYAHLAGGGLNPLYQPAIQSRQYYWTTNATFSDTFASCPFHSDYGPPSVAETLQDVNIYGCDEEALGKIGDSEAAQEFRDLFEDSKKFAEDMQKMIDDVETDTSASDSSAQDIASLTHAAVSGCVRPPPPDNDSSGEVVPADYQEEEGYLNFITDAPTSATLPDGLLYHDSRSFSLYPDPFPSVRLFLEKSLLAGFLRPLPRILEDILKEFQDQSLSYTQYLYNQRLVNLPILLQVFSLHQSLSEASVQASAVDTSTRTVPAMASLDAAMHDLTQAVQTSLPEYTTSLSYFLLRSCLNGPCTDTLQSVVSRALNPSCRPFSSGQYAVDDQYIAKCFCLEEAKGTADYKKYCPK